MSSSFDDSTSGIPIEEKLPYELRDRDVSERESSE